MTRRLQASAQAQLGTSTRDLPPLLLLTDPSRTPDPVAAAARLPSGSGVVYRAFGIPDAGRIGRQLRAVADRCGLVLLVGADPGLARAVRADGVHLPERHIHRLPALRAAWPSALLTCAAHGRGALARARRAGADAALVSPIFPSLSPSAGAPLGRLRFAAMTRDAGLPVYALGGIDAATAPLLVGTGAVGIAAVSALA